MDLSTLASAFLAVWFALAPPSGVQAYAPASQLPPLQQPRSARFQLEGSVAAGPERLTVRGQGAFVMPDRLQVSLEALAPGQNERFDLIAIGQTAYTRTGRGGQWEVSDFSTGSPLGAPGGLPFGGVPTPDALPPEAEARVLEALSRNRPVGPEVVNGVPTDHYRGEVDFLSLAEAIAPDDSSTRQLFRSFTMTLEYWVGRDDRYLHRMKLGLEARVRDATPVGPEALTADLTVNFSDFNRAITIAAPVEQPGAAAPAQVPAQLPARAPARLPNTGHAPPGSLLPVLAGGLLALGAALRRRGRP